MQLVSSNKTFGFFFSGVTLLISIYLFVIKSDLFTIFSYIFLAFILVTIFFNDLLTPLNKLWELFGKLIHLIIGNLLVFLIYYIVFTLIGLPMRLFGFDPLKKKNS